MAGISFSLAVYTYVFPLCKVPFPGNIPLTIPPGTWFSLLASIGNHEPTGEEIRVKSARAALTGLFVVAGLLAGITMQGQSPEDQAPATARQRLGWFQHDKFGLFIHFGPYSVLAGEWQGRTLPSGAGDEWIMQRFNIPVKEYREMARQLNPVKFNADDWVGLAKAAGMKYLVMTAKHHDGFAMYRSRVTDYNIVDWTPYKHDLLKELAEACRKQGIRFCVYYSQREDWDDADGYGNNWDYDRSKKNFDRYLEMKSKPQVQELLTNYGPLGLIWFDRGLETREQAEDFVELVRGLQPLCLINGRVGSYGQDLMGDYQDMTDRGMPVGGLDEPWETPQILNDDWGFSKFDQDWKPPAEVIHILVETVSKGGNYLLDVGPKADGTMPAAAVAILHKVGAWMQQNGESIYGTTASPLPEYPWGRTTVKGNKVYLHVFAWPADGVLRVSAMSGAEVKSAHLVARPAEKLAVSRDHGVMLVTVPAQMPDANDTVVVLELAGPLKVDTPLLTQGSDSPFHLDYMNGITAGKAQKRFNRKGSFFISKWTGPQDSVTWHMLISQTGNYKVRIKYAAREESQGSKYLLTIGPRSLNGAVQQTDEEFDYQTLDLGNITLPKAGPITVRIQPAEAYDHDLMQFQSLELSPIY
jgi:alpha-L-fucosidase